MELFKYQAKNGMICTVHTMYHEDRFDKEWSLRIDLDPYDYYKREQDAKAAGTRLRMKLIDNGCIIIDN